MDTTTHGAGLPYRPSIDGLRGLAVAAVLGYHLGLPWLKGGFLGVSLFFTLSGFLITNLLLAEHHATGGIGLRVFWARRARRLLPAAFGGILLAIAVAAVGGHSDQLHQLPGDVAGALAYAANWRFVLNHSAYQSGYATPSPLLHYWSLAIEEQLYLVVPLLVLLGMRGTDRHRARMRLGGICGLLLVASALATLALGGSHDPNRVYFGTDTRMFELMAGALLAAIVRFPEAADCPGRHALPARGPRTRGRGNVAVTLMGTVPLVGVLALWATVAERDAWLYRGGLWCVAALSCGLIVLALRHGPMIRLLSRRGLTDLGRVSYGLYVYHWPLFLLLDTDRTGLQGGPLVVARLGATAVVATASYRWLEQPIRQGRWRLPRPRLVLWPALPTAALIGAVVTAQLAPNSTVATMARHPIVLSLSRSSAVSGTTTGVVHRVRRPASTAAAFGPTPLVGTTAGKAEVRSLARVLFVGDSLVQQAYPTFADRLQKRGVSTRTIGGAGQSIMWHGAAWLPQLREDVASFDPDVVVLESCCGNFWLDPPWVGPDGRSIPNDTPNFYDEWRQLAAEVSAAAEARGALVLWVLAPPAKTNGWYGPIDRRIPEVNQVYTALVDHHPEMGVVDWRIVGGPDGRFVEFLPNSAGELVKIRHDDGFHFTPAGWDLLADLTLTDLDHEWMRHHGPITDPGLTAAVRSG